MADIAQSDKNIVIAQYCGEIPSTDRWSYIHGTLSPKLEALGYDVTTRVYDDSCGNCIYAMIGFFELELRDLFPDNGTIPSTTCSVTVTMSVSPSGSGTILTNTQNVTSITVSSGTNVTWQAISNTGYKFDHFVSATGATTTLNPFTATVTTNGSITAVFVTSVVCSAMSATLTIPP